MHPDNRWTFRQPPGWPEGLEAEREYGLVSVRPDPDRPGRREWLAGPCWVRATDDIATEIANALAPSRSVRIKHGTSLGAARKLLAGIGVFTTISQSGLRDLADWLATALPTGNPWSKVASFSEIAA